MEIVNWARKQWDRVAAVVAAAAGAVVLLLGWLGASDEVNPAGQIPYVVSGGLVGIFLIALGSTLWLSADLRDEWRKLDRLEQHMLREASSVQVPAPSTGAAELALTGLPAARPDRERLAPEPASSTGR